MKIIPYNRSQRRATVKRCFTAIAFVCLALLCFPTTAQQGGEDADGNQKAAQVLVDQVIDRLANGQAFEAKVRQRVWASGREVVGVGKLTQAAEGTSAFKMTLTIHDGNGKHRPHSFEQVSDGRLAYTRTEIGGKITLKRVDVGWLDEGLRALRRQDRIRPSMKVGGLCEMLDSIQRDYDLRIGASKLDGRSLHVLIGTLKPQRAAAIQSESGREPPDLFPRRVNVFISAEDDPRTGVQRGIPIRIEHRGMDASSNPQQQAMNPNQGRLISLLELYSIQRPASPPHIQKFRFENQDASVTFENETHRYEDRFNIRVSAKQRERFR